MVPLVAVAATAAMAGAAASGAFSPGAPEAPVRDIGQETRDTLAAQVGLMGDQFEAESTWGPRFAGLRSEEMRRYLLGGGGYRGALDVVREAQPTYDELAAASARRQREADVSAVEGLGPRAARALRAVSPQRAALMDDLYGEVSGDLRAGGALDAATARQVRQAVRAGQGARGLGYGPSDVYLEALSTGQVAEARRAARQARAASWIGLESGIEGDPFLQILGRPAASTGAGQSAAQWAGSQTPGWLFDPQSPYASDVWGSNANALAASRIAGANMRAAGVSSGLGLVGAGLGALGSYYRGAGA
jgi:hypothetical protein